MLYCCLNDNNMYLVSILMIYIYTRMYSFLLLYSCFTYVYILCLRVSWTKAFHSRTEAYHNTI